MRPHLVQYWIRRSTPCLGFGVAQSNLFWHRLSVRHCRAIVSPPYLYFGRRLESHKKEEIICARKRLSTVHTQINLGLACQISNLSLPTMTLLDNKITGLLAQLSPKLILDLAVSHLTQTDVPGRSLRAYLANLAYRLQASLTRPFGLSRERQTQC